MLREITVTALYECDESITNLTPAAKVEELVYENIIECFCQDEGFQGLRVDCDDYYHMNERHQYELKTYIGC